MARLPQIYCFTLRARLPFVHSSTDDAAIQVESCDVVTSDKRGVRCAARNLVESLAFGAPLE
jgi:hypothetical protein